MKPWELLGETRTPEGSDVRLTGRTTSTSSWWTARR